MRQASHEESRESEFRIRHGNMPPLNTLRSFEAVSQLGTMRAAAAELGVSHTVVSRHISYLEAWLGVKLIRSGPRGVRLTHEGDLYAHRIKAAFALIVDASSDLRPQQNGGVLRIWCVSGLMTHWLAPRLQTIQGMFPGVDILLRPFERAPGFDEINADVIIGYCWPDEFPENAMALISPHMFPVANPAWVEANPSITSPDKLARIPLIHEVSRQAWTDWFELAGVQLSTPLSGPLLWDAALGIDAALNGQGVVLSHKLIVDPFLESGRLVRLFSSNVRLGSYYLVCGAKHTRPSIIQAFIAWLKRELTTSEHN